MSDTGKPKTICVSMVHHTCSQAVDRSLYVPGNSILGGKVKCICGQETSYYSEWHLDPARAHAQAQNAVDRLTLELREAQAVLELCRSRTT